MRNRKFLPAAVAALLSLAYGFAHANITLLGGRPQIGVELEHEKSADGSGRANAVTLFPGIVWKDGWITRAELLLMREREVETSGAVTERSNEYALGLRLRKDVMLTKHFGGFLRVLAGRRGNRDFSYNYGYIEPALKYELNERIELYSGYRFIRSLDSTSGRDSNQWRIGPGWDFSDQQSLDLRWSRSWDAQSRMRLSDSVELEYSFRF